MHNRELEIKELKKAILESTNNIFSKVIGVEILPIDDLLVTRAAQVKHLIAISHTNDAATLVEYLQAIKRLDEEIIQAMTVKRDLFSIAMANAEKIHQYSA